MEVHPSNDVLLASKQQQQQSEDILSEIEFFDFS